MYFAVAPFASEMAKHPRGGIDLQLWWALESKGFAWLYLIYALGFGGLCAAFFRYAYDPHPILVLDDNGFTFHQWFKTRRIEWSDVHSVMYWEVPKNQSVFEMVWRGAESRVAIQLEPLPKWFQWNRLLTRQFFRGDIVIFQRMAEVHPGFIATEIAKRFPHVHGLVK